MATATKKPTAAAKSAKPAKPEAKPAAKAAAKPAAKPEPKPAAKPAAKAAAKPAAKAAAKAPSKSKSKKVVEPPPPVVYVSAFTVGNKVTHPSFGDGKVVAIDRDQLRIQFGKDEKVILDGFVKAGGKG
jgi:sRNA-binding protein